MMKVLFHAAASAALIAALTVAACSSGSSSTPTTPTPPTSTTPPTTTPPATTPPTTTPPSMSATITIGTDGRVSPASVTVLRGGRVTMINNDSRSHDMSSDPHPEHTQCPELNQWGFLTAGQQRTSSNLNTARTCGFHDHNLPANTGLQGSVIIQ